MSDEDEKIIRPDFSVLKEGQSIFKGNILDKDGNIIGPIPTKQYSSHEEYLASLQSSPENIQDKPELFLWKDINAMVFPKERWLVKDLIPKSGMAIIASISGDGKSWVALDLAKCISTGTNFLGDERFKTEQAKVLYIDAENPKNEIQRRGRQLSFPDTDQFLFQIADGLNLNTDDKFEELKKLIQEQEIKVIIVDTFRAVAGGLKEEKAEEIREFFNRFKIFKDSIAIIWLDHYRKPAQHEKKTPQKEYLFGSQDKTANAEILLMMKKEENEISVYQRKNRLGKEINGFKILMTDTTDDNGLIKTSISFGGEIDEKESKKDEAKEYILELLKEGPMITPEIVVILQKEKRIGEKNTREALKELLSDGVIDKRKRHRADEYFLKKDEDNKDTEADRLLDSF